MNLKYLLIKYVFCKYCIQAHWLYKWYNTKYQALDILVSFTAGYVLFNNLQKYSINAIYWNTTLTRLAYRRIIYNCAIKSLLNLHTVHLCVSNKFKIITKGRKISQLIWTRSDVKWLNTLKGSNPCKQKLCCVVSTQYGSVW